MKLELSRPIYLDAVAADFPDLQIVMAHPAWPWQDEQLAVALHKPNTWIDLSGWSPRRFAPDLVSNIQGALQDRVLFGTDYPFLTHEQWFGAWATLDVPDAVDREGAACATPSDCSDLGLRHACQHSAGSDSRTPLRFASKATSESAGREGSAAGSAGRPSSVTHEVHPP